MIVLIIAVILECIKRSLDISLPLPVQIFSPFLVYLIAKKIFKITLNIEFASGNDQVFQTKTDGVINVIVGTMVLEQKVNSTDFVLKLYENLLNHPSSDKFRRILRRCFGLSYWILAANFDVKNHVSLITDPLNTENELQEFLSKHLQAKYPFAPNQPEWMVYVFENYLGNHSAVVLKVHHAYGDGISLQSYFSYIGGDKNYELTPLPKPSTLKRIYLTVLGILRIPALTKMLLEPKDKNVFRSDKLKATGRKLLETSEGISLEKIKAITKKAGTTVNDFILMSVLISLKEYARKFHNEQIKEIGILIPNSLRPPAKVMNLSNMIMGYFTKFPLHNEFSSSTEKYPELIYFSNYFKSRRNFSDPALQWLLTELFCLVLPLVIIDRCLIKFLASKPTCFCSNVPGPSTPLHFLSNKVVRSFFFGNLMGNCGLGFTCFSYDGMVTVSIAADEAYRINPNDYMRTLREFTEDYFSR